MNQKNDAQILRDLVKQYQEVCERPEQDELRRLWRKHNSLEKTRPLLIVRGGVAFNKEIPQVYELECEDPFFRRQEKQLRGALYKSTLGDDRIFEPWLTVKAVHRCSGWGVEVDRHFSGQDGGSWKVDYPIKTEEDLQKLRMPWHEIDEEATQQKHDRLADAVGDLIDISVDRGPNYRVWSGDLATDLGYLRGIEHFMLDMHDRPDWLHEMLQFMRDGVLRTHEQAEDAGDWGLNNHQNQSMPYSEELEDPAPDVYGVDRSELWCFVAAQEFAQVGPDNHDEFMLQYQLPIISKFGLVAYGCCEDLTNKIDILRRIPNLRRIAVTPWADVQKCAEQIGEDYVISWRPSPERMVCSGFSEDRVRRMTEEAMEACKGLHVDISLKDIQTVQNEPDRLKKWASITRDVVEHY
ncbi:MAG: hypothetical protein ACOCSQ_04825 [Planctomycetota bacterium]